MNFIRQSRRPRSARHATGRSLARSPQVRLRRTLLILTTLLFAWLLLADLAIPLSAQSGIGHSIGSSEETPTSPSSPLIGHSIRHNSAELTEPQDPAPAVNASPVPTPIESPTPTITTEPPGLPTQPPSHQTNPPHVVRHYGSKSPTPGPTLAPPPAPTVWWQDKLGLPILGRQQTPTLSLTEALQRAAGQAPEIASLQAVVDERRAELLGEQAAFDWSVFADSGFDRDNVPVGSSLDGANNRLRDRRWDLQGGLRNRNQRGGEFSIYQDFGFRRSNSSFLTPPTQGTGRITAEYTHPLLRRSGERFNLGPTHIAGIREQESAARLVAGTEDHLFRVAQAYWDLVLARGEVALTHRAWLRTSEIVTYMKRRQDIDVGRTQMLQAQSAQATREAAWIEATFEASRAQNRLLRLIYGESFQEQVGVEVITTSTPATQGEPAASAPFDLRSHPQVIAAREAVQASTVELDLSLKDVEPQLDLVLSAYSAGLRGKGKFLPAAEDAWTDSEPGFSIGLTFEYPLGNRRAEAEVQRKHAQLRRLKKRFQVVVSDVALNLRDRDIAVEKATALLSQSQRALHIAEQELKQLETRRKLLIDGSNIADLYLDTLLRSQERLSNAERRVLFSQVDVEVALAAQQHARAELRTSMTAINSKP